MDDDLAKDGTKLIWNRALMIIFLIVVAALGFSAHLISHKADTPIEQAAEFIIEKELGVPIDFSADMKKDQAKLNIPGPVINDEPQSKVD